MVRRLRYLLILALLATAGWWTLNGLPSYYNPFIPLAPDDPPNLVTRYKLRQLARDPAACLALLTEARARNMIDFRAQQPTAGECPLPAAVRVTRFGPVRLSSSFLASCPLAVSSAMYIHQRARPLAQALMGSPLSAIDHLGSYACRNIYHRASGRRSEHASADALDVSAFRFANGERISVAQGWHDAGRRGATLHGLFNESCPYFGNVLGPDYNRAHAGHFHFGMGGFGLCR